MQRSAAPGMPLGGNAEWKPKLLMQTRDQGRRAWPNPCRGGWAREPGIAATASLLIDQIALCSSFRRSLACLVATACAPPPAITKAAPHHQRCCS